MVTLLNKMRDAVEFITLELRPRLRSCNAFIAVRKDVRAENVRIRLSASSIVLTLGDLIIRFSLPSVKVIPASLSALSVTSNWICFRLQTAPTDPLYGSFGAEVVTEAARSVRSDAARSPPILDDLKLLCETSERVVILCACCKNAISESISFERFLPAPDAEYDPSEWFCCKHSSDIAPAELQPRDSDYLYTSCFSVLHRSIFKSTVYLDNRSLTCSKCLLHVGTLHKGGLYKIWNCCVDYKAQSGTTSSTVNATNPLSDFLILVRDSLGEMLGEEVILRTYVGAQSHCLLIKPMDHELNLITEPCHKIPDDTNIIPLQQKCVTKVLYKYETSEVSAAAAAVNYLSTKYYEVGLPIIEAGLKYLVLSTKRLPHVYRAVVADYFLGYIVLQEIN